jgi:alanine-synthesizing transaminase
VLDGLAVWDLSMVNPDLPPPRLVLDRLLESVTKPTNHRYAVSRGVRRLREGFAFKYSDTFGIKLDPETQVCVCLGSKDATFHALRALVEPGDAVVVAVPSYPAHPSAVALAGAHSVPWRLVEEPEMAAQTLAAVLQSSGARLVLLNIPSNPAGVVVSEDWWRAVGAVCAQYGATIINDFVYGEMCFSGKPAVSALRAADVGARCVEVYSLSKAYNLPGWRVGALVGDAEIVGAVSRLKSHSDYGLFLPLQYAAAVALTCTEDIVRPTVATYERRLKVLSSGIQRLGWSVAQPKAGACLWARYPAELSARVESEGSRSIAVARHLLATTGVVVTPGIVFGEEFDDYIRFAVVTTEERLRDVVRILDQQPRGA